MKRYRFYNTTICRTVNGRKKLYKVCDVCGAETLKDYGYYLDVCFKGFGYSGKRGLCPKCAAELLPHLAFAIGGIETLMREKKMDAKTYGLLSEKQIEKLGWNDE